MLEQIRSMRLSSTGFLPLQAKKEPSIDRFTPKDLQVNVSHEVRKVFMCFIIGKLFGVVDAAIQSSVDCED
jgi:hypothetical protein